VTHVFNNPAERKLTNQTEFFSDNFTKIPKHVKFVLKIKHLYHNKRGLLCRALPYVRPLPADVILMLYFDVMFYLYATDSFKMPPSLMRILNLSKIIFLCHFLSCFLTLAAERAV